MSSVHASRLVIFLKLMVLCLPATWSVQFKSYFKVENIYVVCQSVFFHDTLMIIFKSSRRPFLSYEFILFRVLFQHQVLMTKQQICILELLSFKYSCLPNFHSIFKFPLLFHSDFNLYTTELIFLPYFIYMRNIRRPTSVYIDFQPSYLYS